MLTGPEIEKYRSRGSIKIEPFDPKQLNPNSCNLRLGSHILEYIVPPWWRRCWLWLIGQPWCLDMAKPNPFKMYKIPDKGLILKPGRLYLGSTEEYTESHGFMPEISGRSSVGRLGVQIHQTAGFGDDGFCGDWTLEISVIYPTKVYAGVNICQVSFVEVRGTRRPYKGKYLGQRGPKASQLWKDFEEKNNGRREKEEETLR